MKTKRIYRNDILKDLRRMKGLSLRQAEEQTGVSKTTIMRAEDGWSSLGIETLASLANGYKIPLPILFDFNFKLDVDALVSEAVKKCA